MKIATVLLLLILSANANAQPTDSVSMSIQFSNNQQKPLSVPVMTALSRSLPYFDGGMVGLPMDAGAYQPTGNGGFIKINGLSEKKFVITTGVWRLLVGDRPVIGLELRDTSGAYAKPALLPHVGVKGTIRLELVTSYGRKFLEDFSSVTAKLIAGEPSWVCKDNESGFTLTLTAYPFTENYGCALTVSIESKSGEQAQLNWHYSDAAFVADSSSHTAFRYDKFTRILLGTTGKNSNYRQGLTQTFFSATAGKNFSDTLICLWGYDSYDTTAVNEAYERLRFRPFSSEAWVSAMKEKWFDHWIGRGLDPLKKFTLVQQHAAAAIEASKKYWNGMRNNVVIKTGDKSFDNVVQSLGSRLISNYEYPAFTHGSNFMKYGKINGGLYGMEAAGLHNQVASTLEFISGTQDIKGRHRYFEPVFTISQWAEEINPYFIEQVWYHYRWTGDKNFLIAMWPSVRRALEHFIATSNPLHDGYFTGYYENWNGDGKGRGGSGALWTAMAIKALQAGYEIAALLNDKDWDRDLFQVTDNKTLENDFRLRYKRLLSKTEAAYETRYNKKIGAYSSSDWNSALRMMPGNEESNYAIWRETGDPLRNYCSLRFIRDTYHQPTANGVIEFSNKDWPVCWSNHFDSYAEAMSSIASAAMANDINNYWPLLKTASDKIYTIPECTAIAGGRSQLSLESDQMFIMAVVNNIFGIKPYFGENLLVLRPSFPDAWKNPAISIPDLAYTYSSTNNEIRMSVTTPVKRIVQVEIPVRQSVKEVYVNGKKAGFEIKKEVNYCRIVIKSDAGTEHDIRVTLASNDFSIKGKTNLSPNEDGVFNIKNAEIVQVTNTQDDFGTINHDGKTIHILPTKKGNYTLFAELKKGNVTWYQPIELVIRDTWSIHEEYLAWEEETPGKSNPAKLLSPAIDTVKRVLRFRLSSFNQQRLTGNMEVVIGGHSFVKPVILMPGLSKEFEIPLTTVLPGLSPGTIPFEIKFANHAHSSHAINWKLPLQQVESKKLVAIDLRNDYNIGLADLYGNRSFKWRIDYTGAAVGVDWRDTLYSDNLGYKLFSSPTSVISYGVLPEQMSPSWWPVPAIPDSLPYPVPFSFIEHGQNKKNVLALVNAENNFEIPSEAIINLANPLATEKIYLLTANLTKPCKSYYPAAEIEIVYDTGKKQVVQLIPPYNMPSFVQAYCPDAYHVPLGSIEYKQTMDFDSPGLSVTDLVTDPNLKIRKIIIRCVASETAVGIIGLTMLTTK